MRSIRWSTISKAALRSRSVRGETELASAAVTITETVFIEQFPSNGNGGRRHIPPPHHSSHPNPSSRHHHHHQSPTHRFTPSNRHTLTLHTYYLPGTYPSDRPPHPIPTLPFPPTTLPTHIHTPIYIYIYINIYINIYIYYRKFSLIVIYCSI